jgi:hypothetical protein
VPVVLVQEAWSCDPLYWLGGVTGDGLVLPHLWYGNAEAAPPRSCNLYPSFAAFLRVRGSLVDGIKRLVPGRDGCPDQEVTQHLLLVLGGGGGLGLRWWRILERNP